MFDKRKDISQEGPRAQFDAGVNEPAPAKPAPVSGRAAVIGPRIVINGSIAGDEDLLIEGRVEGSIELGDHRVDIGPSGKVHADIDAKEVKVEGEVRGDINGSEKVIISRTGRVQGNLKAPRVTLEDGAKFKGSIDMDPGESARPAARAEPKPVAPAVESKPQVQNQARAANGSGAVGTSSSSPAAVVDKPKASPGLNLESK